MFFIQSVDNSKRFSFIKQFFNDHPGSAGRAPGNFFLWYINNQCLPTLGALNLYRLGFFSHRRLSLEWVRSGIDNRRKGRVALNAAEADPFPFKGWKLHKRQSEV